MPLSHSFLREKPFVFQAITLLTLVFGCAILFAFAALLFETSILGYKGAVAFTQSIEQKIKHIGITKVIQTASQIMVFMLPAVIFGYLISGNALSYLKLDRPPTLGHTMLAIGITLSAGVFVQFIIELNQSMEFPAFLGNLEAKLFELQEMNNRLMNAFLDINSLPQFLVLFLMIGIVPAISEEFLFRGVMQRMLTDGRSLVFIPILVTAITFALIHFQFHNFLAITFMGLVLGYLYHWSQNLWIPIIAHMLNNGLQVLLVYLYKIEVIGINVEAIGTVHYGITITSGFLLVLFFFLFKKMATIKS